MNTFGKKLKAIREKKHLTLDRLSEILSNKYDAKISKSMLYRWENGSDISMSYVSIVADYFKLDPYQVLGIKPTKIREVVPSLSITLPIYSHLFAGMPDGAEEDVIGTIDVPDRIAIRAEIESRTVPAPIITDASLTYFSETFSINLSA